MTELFDGGPGLLGTDMERSRVIGRLTGEATGPTLVVTVGIHGNEQAGVIAARRVVRGLTDADTTIRGTVVFLAGNLLALERGCRFVDIDLNRAWVPSTVAALDDPAAPAGEPAEILQMRELLGQLRREALDARGELYFLDLHTSSAEGPPFLTIGDTLRNRHFAQRFPLPLILGLEEQVDGALLEFLNNFGFITMGVEGGAHDAPSSADRHEAVLWLALIHAGLVDEHRIAEVEAHRRLLREASRGAPRIVEVRHRHAITPDDEFRMKPGFVNFEPIVAGQVLARDARGDVAAPERGMVLLPLYQGQGDDGFFVSREVSGFWLGLSALLRRLRLGSLMTLLPGVRRRRDDPKLLDVDTRIARYYPLEVFHLLGFRKRRISDGRLTVSRRLFDVKGPGRIDLG